MRLADCAHAHKGIFWRVNAALLFVGRLATQHSLQYNSKMWIQVRSMDGRKSVRMDNLSKLTKIEELRDRLVDEFEAEPARQRLFYRGKQVQRPSPLNYTLVDRGSQWERVIGHIDTEMFMKYGCKVLGRAFKETKNGGSLCSWRMATPSLTMMSV